MLRYCELTSPVQLSELNFQWSKRRQNGEVVEIETAGTNSKYSVNHEGLLTISKAELSDSGSYQVNISNDQGSALHIVQLEVVSIQYTTEVEPGGGMLQTTEPPSTGGVFETVEPGSGTYIAMYMLTGIVIIIKIVTCSEKRDH